LDKLATKFDKIFQLHLNNVATLPKVAVFDRLKAKLSQTMSADWLLSVNWCVCVAVVSHIGVRAIGGHYIVDVFHPGYNCWVRCDDNNVCSVPTANVTKFASSKVPYLIFYRRLEPS